MDIVIIGGSTAGLAAAIALQKTGHSVRVYEQSNLTEPTGLGVGLQPFAVEALMSIGLTNIASLGVPILSTGFYTPDGKLLYAGKKTPEGAVTKVGIKRAVLQTALHNEALKCLGPSSLYSHCELKHCHQDDNFVYATLHDKQANADFQIKADLLLGADGLHSTVRSIIFPDQMQFNYSGIITWRGMTVADDFLKGRMLLMGGRKAKTVIYPAQYLPNGKVKIYWAAEVLQETQVLKTPIRNMPGHFDEFAGNFDGFKFENIAVPDLYRSATDVLKFPIVDREPMQSWVDKKIVLLGDAAHPMFPMGGNGASQAIVDATTLARSLRLSGNNVSKGLNQYMALRLKKVNQVVRSNRSLGPDSILTDAEASDAGMIKIDGLTHYREILEGYKSLTQPLGV